MSTITRERAELKSFITGFLSDPMHDDQSAKSMTAEVFRIALASLEAEADAVCQHQWKFGGANKLQRQKQCVKCGRVELVAPPEPVAPDLKELEAILDWILMLPCPTPKATHFAKRLAVVIDACRVAMPQELQKSAGVSNNCRSNENVHGL